MPEGAVLEPPVEEVIDADVVGEENIEEGPQEVPSVMSVTNRYLIGRMDVSPPDPEDGSRIMRLFSGNGGTIIEANLSPQLCIFAAEKLTEIEVIAEDGEEESDGGSATD